MSTVPKVVAADLRRILMVQAAEREHPELFDADSHRLAAIAALGAESDAQILARRAEQLCFQLPAPLAALARRDPLPEWLWLPALGAGLLLGLAANYLGPAAEFHVIYNPVGALLLWNLAIYLAVALRLFWPGPRSSGPIPRLLPQLARTGARLASGVRDSNSLPNLTATWWRHYLELAATVLRARSSLLLHAAAIGLGLGAIAGMYLRGLFVAYHAVWRSTFIHDPQSVGTLLNLILAPAAWLLDGGTIPPGAIAELLSDPGASASAWLHRLALMLLLIVVLPRAALAARAWRNSRPTVPLALDLERLGLRQSLHRVKQIHIRRIRDGADAEIRAEIAVFAQRMAAFIRVEFFDRQIRPRLQDFRSRGGSIAALEQSLNDQAAAFDAEIQRHLQQAQAEFEQGLQARMRILVGRQLQLAASQHAPPPTTALGHELAGGVAGRLSAAVAAVVTTAVSASLGSLSGGIGKTVGIAIVSHLLGTSGPVGLLIGAAVGVAGGGAAWMLGRERLQEKARSWTIPAAVAALALRESRLDQARDELERGVDAQIREALEPAVEDITRQLLRSLPQSLATASRS